MGQYSKLGPRVQRVDAQRARDREREVLRGARQGSPPGQVGQGVSLPHVAGSREDGGETARQDRENIESGCVGACATGQEICERRACRSVPFSSYATRQCAI
jgi:hypothetical protein